MADFERIEPGTSEWAQYHANHIHRYRFAAGLLKEMRPGTVLDAACGVGYGSAYLASQLGCRVVAVDRSAHALSVAAREFPDPRIVRCEDDCATLAVAGQHAPFDAVVTLETIEHLKEPERFLTRCRELASPGATIIASTPNSLVTEADAARKWEYHEREYSPEEAIALLEASGWGDVRLFGQRLNQIGRLREDLRRELHAIATRPFNRLGEMIQRYARGYRPSPLLPEKLEDFEMIEMTPAECHAMGRNGPFVLICVGHSLH